MNVLEYSTASHHQDKSRGHRASTEPHLNRLKDDPILEGNASLTPEEKLFRMLTAGQKPQARFSAKTGTDSGWQRAPSSKLAEMIERIDTRKVQGLLNILFVCALFLVCLASILNFVGKKSAAPAVQNEVKASNPAPQTSLRPAEDPAVMVQPYRLVGISWDENGYVAMIERTGQSAKFVREGEDLGDGFRVGDITEFAVQVHGGGRVWSLR